MEGARAAAALLVIAACFACSAAAPVNEQTGLDLYDGGTKGDGCYYNFQHYGEGDRIMTNEPCLNCTCHNRMLMCYLRVCPFTKPIGQDCTIEKRGDQCCPVITCPDVHVDLLTSTSTTSPSEYGSTDVGHLEKYGCSIGEKFYSEGSKIPSTPNKPCELCYCIRNMTTCVMQECTLHVDGCTPVYHKDTCCPVRYSCDHPEDEVPLLDDMTTTVRPTPGFMLTTTLPPGVTQDCVHDDGTFPDGALINTEKACEHCYCMKGDIVCVVQECGTPMENEGKNCTSMPPREGQCCPDTYICENDVIEDSTSDELLTTYLPMYETTKLPEHEGSGERDVTPVDELEGSGHEQSGESPLELSSVPQESSEPSVVEITTPVAKQVETSSEEPEDLGHPTDRSSEPTERAAEESTEKSAEESMEPVHETVITTTAPFVTEYEPVPTTEKELDDHTEPSLDETLTTQSTSGPVIMEREPGQPEPSLQEVLPTEIPKKETLYEIPEDSDETYATTEKELPSDSTRKSTRLEESEHVTEKIDSQQPGDQFTLQDDTSTDKYVTETSVDDVTDMIEESMLTEGTLIPELSESQKTTSQYSGLQTEAPIVQLSTLTLPDDSMKIQPEETPDVQQSTVMPTDVTPHVIHGESTEKLTEPTTFSPIIETSQSSSDITEKTTDHGKMEETESGTTITSTFTEISTESSSGLEPEEKHTTEKSEIISSEEATSQQPESSSESSFEEPPSTFTSQESKPAVESSTESQDILSTEKDELDLDAGSSSTTTTEPKITNEEPYEKSTENPRSTGVPQETPIVTTEISKDEYDVKPTIPTEDKIESEVTPIQPSEEDVTESNAEVTDVSTGDAFTTAQGEEDILITSERVALTTTESPSEVDLETLASTTLKPMGEIVESTTLLESTMSTVPDLSENEIHEEEPNVILPHIPGEGDCLVDGITYTNDSFIPNSNKCQIACKCVSSIVKCEQVQCSPPPENMINCQPVYDAKESCCPTYVCDHSKETVAPESHNQMLDLTTEQPLTDKKEEHASQPSQAPECNSEECHVKEEPIIPIHVPEICSSESCVPLHGQASVPNRASDEVLNEEDQKQTPTCTSDDCGQTEQAIIVPIVPVVTEPSGECTHESCVPGQKGPEQDSLPNTDVSECSGDECSLTKPAEPSRKDCVEGECEPHIQTPLEPSCTDEKCHVPVAIAPELSTGEDCKNGECGQSEQYVPESQKPSTDQHYGETQEPSLATATPSGESDLNTSESPEQTIQPISETEISSIVTDQPLSETPEPELVTEQQLSSSVTQEPSILTDQSTETKEPMISPEQPTHEGCKDEKCMPDIKSPNEHEILTKEPSEETQEPVLTTDEPSRETMTPIIVSDQSCKDGECKTEIKSPEETVTDQPLKETQEQTTVDIKQSIGEIQEPTIITEHPSSEDADLNTEKPSDVTQDLAEKVTQEPAVTTEESSGEIEKLATEMPSDEKQKPDLEDEKVSDVTHEPGVETEHQYTETEEASVVTEKQFKESCTDGDCKIDIISPEEPAIVTEKSSEETIEPFVVTEQPSDETQTPLTATEQPSGENREPATTSEKSSDEQSSIETENPFTETHETTEKPLDENCDDGQCKPGILSTEESVTRTENLTEEILLVTELPLGEKQQTTVKTEQPSEETQLPELETDKPSRQTQEPTRVTDQPSIETQQTTLESEQPSGQTYEPSLATEQPPQETQEPAVSSETPSEETKQTTTQSEQPSGQTQVPDIATDQPLQESQEPGVATKQPSGETQEQPNTTEQPSGETQKPSIVTEQTSSETQESTLASEEPFGEICKNGECGKPNIDSSDKQEPVTVTEFSFDKTQEPAITQQISMESCVEKDCGETVTKKSDSIEPSILTDIPIGETQNPAVSTVQPFEETQKPVIMTVQPSSANCIGEDCSGPETKAPEANEPAVQTEEPSIELGESTDVTALLSGVTQEPSGVTIEQSSEECKSEECAEPEIKVTGIQESPSSETLEPSVVSESPSVEACTDGLCPEREIYSPDIHKNTTEQTSFDNCKGDLCENPDVQNPEIQVPVVLPCTGNQCVASSEAPSVGECKDGLCEKPSNHSKTPESEVPVEAPCAGNECNIAVSIVSEQSPESNIPEGHPTVEKCEGEECHDVSQGSVGCVSENCETASVSESLPVVTDEVTESQFALSSVTDEEGQKDDIHISTTESTKDVTAGEIQTSQPQYESITPKSEISDESQNEIDDSSKDVPTSVHSEQEITTESKISDKNYDNISTENPFDETDDKINEIPTETSLSESDKISTPTDLIESSQSDTTTDFIEISDKTTMAYSEPSSTEGYTDAYVTSPQSEKFPQVSLTIATEKSIEKEPSTESQQTVDSGDISDDKTSEPTSGEDVTRINQETTTAYFVELELHTHAPQDIEEQKPIEKEGVTLSIPESITNEPDLTTGMSQDMETPVGESHIKETEAPDTTLESVDHKPMSTTEITEEPKHEEDTSKPPVSVTEGSPQDVTDKQEDVTIKVTQQEDVFNTVTPEALSPIENEKSTTEKIYTDASSPLDETSDSTEPIHDEKDSVTTIEPETYTPVQAPEVTYAKPTTEPEVLSETTHLPKEYQSSETASEISVEITTISQIFTEAEPKLQTSAVPDVTESPKLESTSLYKNEFEGTTDQTFNPETDKPDYEHSQKEVPSSISPEEGVGSSSTETADIQITELPEVYLHEDKEESSKTTEKEPESATSLPSEEKGPEYDIPTVASPETTEITTSEDHEPDVTEHVHTTQSSSEEQSSEPGSTVSEIDSTDAPNAEDSGRRTDVPSVSDGTATDSYETTMANVVLDQKPVDQSTIAPDIESDLDIRQGTAPAVFVEVTSGVPEIEISSTQTEHRPTGSMSEITTVPIESTSDLEVFRPTSEAPQSEDLPKTTSSEQSTDTYGSTSMPIGEDQPLKEEPISSADQVSEHDTSKPDSSSEGPESTDIPTSPHVTVDHFTSPEETSEESTKEPIREKEPTASPEDISTIQPSITEPIPDQQTSANFNKSETPESSTDGKIEPASMPSSEAEEEPKPTFTEEPPGVSAETSELPSPGEDVHHQSPDQFPTPPYGGSEPDYEQEEDQPFGPGTCRYGGKVYVSAQQIPRDDPCDFCFCFRSDIICLQQSCPPPIHGCHEEPINGFCCPRYECPVSMATTLNVTTTTTTTTTTLPPHFLPHAYKGAAQRRGCQIKGHSYQVGEVVRSSSGPCLHCTCGGDGQMKCDPKVCTPEPMLRQMIAAAVSTKRRR